ncbi:hypothetical protein L207DRAFT_527695 [Hyaloscypha variabilis F]|uniref:Uncharacterized protein n=1 Tax=Hyaloscypha variabilis (strain UAMH 11265 / GT02V1 / F) TaxID=1149755 RepID=A0A2J6RWC3_HYAVF|nr:hypothetical protein L207DRAFT_527695 [Hyaloscypha variabilis F]
MPPSTQPPVPPPTTPSTTKPNLNLDIQILSSILHTIHSTSLIARQPTATARTTSASTVSALESRLSKLSAALQKRESCGKKLQRLLTCRDREYEEFVVLGEEIGEVYEGLLGGACPTPVVQVEQVPSPEDSVGSSRSGDSGDRGLWMKGSKGSNERRENAEEKSGDEQIEEQAPSSQRMGGSSKLSKSSSGSTIKASGVNSSKEVEGEISIDEQIQEWMKSRKGKQERGEKREEEKPVQADF